MFTKIKKHRLSLFLLAMVGMLSVYYVLMPTTDEDAKPVVNQEEPENIKYSDFAEARIQILDERNKLVAEYEAKITDTSVSLTDVEDYLLEINELTKLTETEVYLETTIINLGYEDSLVYVLDGVINISVLAETFTVAEYIEINKLAKGQFGNDFIVLVNYINSGS